MCLKSTLDYIDRINFNLASSCVPFMTPIERKINMLFELISIIVIKFHENYYCCRTVLNRTSCMNVILICNGFSLLSPNYSLIISSQLLDFFIQHVSLIWEPHS